jgi:hypothetical protein
VTPKHRRRSLGSEVRVCPETSCWIAAWGEAEEGERLALEAFPILGQSPAAAKPGEGATLDDLEVGARQNAFHRALEFRPLVASVGVEPNQEREGCEQALERISLATPQLLMTLVLLRGTAWR